MKKIKIKESLEKPVAMMRGDELFELIKASVESTTTPMTSTTTNQAKKMSMV